MAVFALIRIWFGGQLGASQAFAGIAIALVGLAVPAFYLSHAIMLPRLTDIETTPQQPLEFKKLAGMRPADANRIEDPDAAVAAEQQAAYPEVRPMELERSAPEAFDIVHEAVKRLGWNIVLAEPADEDSPGQIEATDRTLLVGFTDDVAIRVTGDDSSGEDRRPLGFAVRLARSRRECRAHRHALRRGAIGPRKRREDRARTS